MDPRIEGLVGRKLCVTYQLACEGDHFVTLCDECAAEDKANATSALGAIQQGAHEDVCECCALSAILADAKARKAALAAGQVTIDRDAGVMP